MRNLWKTLLLVRQADKGAFRRRVLYVFLQSVLPLTNVYLLKLLIDSLTNGGGDWSVWLLVMTGVFLLNRIVGALDRVNNDVLSQRLTDYMSDIMQRQAARLDLAYYDTPSYHDTLHRAQQEAGNRPLAVLNNAMSVVGAVVSTVIVIGMMTQVSWLIVLVMIVGVLPSFVVRLHKARSIYGFRRENTQLYRRTAYYGHLLTSRESAAEMRTLRAAPHFRQLFVESRARLVKQLLKISRRLGAADVLCGLIEAVAMLAVIWMLASRTFDQLIGVGSFVMLFEAFRRGQGYMAALVGGIAGLYDNRLFVGNLFEFLSLKPALSEPSNPMPVPEQINEVELCDVTFRYPGMNHDVLSHYNFKAAKGEITLLRGENGRGKSTVLKLLLRLYDPQQGSVKMNGIDVRNFSQRQLRVRMGVLFQNFVCYQCTLRDNVALGNAQRYEEDVDRALKMSGADEVVSRLANGVETQLGRMFEGGAELSMGQWQRIALARALQSDAPVLLLDEPTAWQDPESRKNFESYLELLKRDKIIIMVTHT